MREKQRLSVEYTPKKGDNTPAPNALSAVVEGVINIDDDDDVTATTEVLTTMAGGIASAKTRMTTTQTLQWRTRHVHYQLK